MTSVTPAAARYKDDSVTAAPRLLCEAMGWRLDATLADKNPGTTSRAIAVVQTNPLIVGTVGGLLNYSTFVDCER